MLHQGGFERVCVMTARLLKEKGYDVVIVVFSMEDIAYDVSGLTVMDLNLKAQTSKIGKVINVFKRCLKLSRIQKRLKTDISYSFGMTANISNALSFGAKKKIMGCRSFEEVKNEPYMKLISSRSDKILCCSKKMADMVQCTYRLKNVQALWNPCDIQNILKQSQEEPEKDIDFFKTEDKILVSMGREDDIKGFWHLIKIFKKVNEEENSTRLAIVGDGSFIEYKRLVKELGIEKRVFFTGLKTNPFPYLKESDIYILTSLSEGLPNVLIEALALEVPIVATNCLSGPAEILHEDFKDAEARTKVFKGNYGILSPVLSWEKNTSVEWQENGKVKLEKTEDDLAGAVLTLLRDANLYEKYKKSSTKRAKDFSTDRYLEGLISCMEQL